MYACVRVCAYMHACAGILEMSEVMEVAEMTDQYCTLRFLLTAFRSRLFRIAPRKFDQRQTEKCQIRPPAHSGLWSVAGDRVAVSEPPVTGASLVIACDRSLDVGRTAGGRHL